MCGQVFSFLLGGHRRVELLCRGAGLCLTSSVLAKRGFPRAAAPSLPNSPHNTSALRVSGYPGFQALRSCALDPCPPTGLPCPSLSRCPVHSGLGLLTTFGCTNRFPKPGPSLNDPRPQLDGCHGLRMTKTLHSAVSSSFLF